MIENYYNKPYRQMNDIEKERFLYRFLRAFGIQEKFLHNMNHFHTTSGSVSSMKLTKPLTLGEYIKVCKHFDSELIQNFDTFCAWSETPEGGDFWAKMSLLWRLYLLYNAKHNTKQIDYANEIRHSIGGIEMNFDAIHELRDEIHNDMFILKDDILSNICAESDLYDFLISLKDGNR